MTRTTKIVRNIGIGVAALIVLLIVTALIVVRTDWFRNYVRQEIITATENGTGGNVELRSFEFDEWQFKATVADFVIHGHEPPGAAPFVSPGDHVEKGQVICIVEAMKLMNEIEADASGEIVRCLVTNGQAIEYGQPLFSIRAQ